MKRLLAAMPAARGSAHLVQPLVRWLLPVSIGAVRHFQAAVDVVAQSARLRNAGMSRSRTQPALSSAPAADTDAAECTPVRDKSCCAKIVAKGQWQRVVVGALQLLHVECCHPFSCCPGVCSKPCVRSSLHVDTDTGVHLCASRDITLCGTRMRAQPMRARGLRRRRLAGCGILLL